MMQNVVVLGTSGNVGRELVSQIQTKDQKSDNINPTRIVGVANSSNIIFDARGIDEQILSCLSTSREDAIQGLEREGEKINNLQQFMELVKSEWLEWEVIFADVTAGKNELLDFHSQVLTNSSNAIVTANKNPISLYNMADFHALTWEYGRYNTNTTVMGWWWVLDFVEARTRINDMIKNVSGVFSWTMGYIMSELQKREDTFAEVVKNAKQGWYTEPNPMDDLNGLDVARKLVILARYAWHEVNINDVQVEPLIDLKYGELEWDEFMIAIQEENERFSQEIQKAADNWEVLRYIWEMTYNKESWDLKLFVWLRSVPENSDLGNLSWTANLAVVETDILHNDLNDPIPHVIKSRWAGLAVTAGAVRSGIASMLPAWLPRR